MRDRFTSRLDYTPYDALPSAGYARARQRIYDQARELVSEKRARAMTRDDVNGAAHVMPTRLSRGRGAARRGAGGASRRA